MELTNINPGIKIGMKQSFTIMTSGRIFFLTHDEVFDRIEWDMLMDDSELSEKVEKILRNYLTNQ